MISSRVIIKNVDLKKKLKCPPIFGHVIKFTTKIDKGGYIMGRKRKKYTAQFKAKVAFEAAKGDRNITEIASEFGVHPQQVRAWKREFLEKMHLVFEKEKNTTTLQKELEKAYQKIGQLEVERDFLSGLLKRC